MEDSVCLCDFAGNSRDPGFWYDYYPIHKGVKFGGILSDIPKFMVDHEPTEEECEMWINAHSQFDYRVINGITAQLIILENEDDIEKTSLLLQEAVKEKRDETTEKIQG